MNEIFDNVTKYISDHPVPVLVCLLVILVFILVKDK